jgi:hypothetical protein
MKCRCLVSCVALLLVLAAGCNSPLVIGANAPVIPPRGFVLTDVKAPLSADNQGVKLPVANELVGRASCKQVVWVVSTGDSSIEAAAKAAGITNISYVDYEYFDVLGGVYSVFTVVVHGN